MVITEAIPADHISLTELTISSKSHWNYSKAQIKEWLPDLTITASYIKSNQVYKLLVENEIIAYYGYYSTDEKEVLLDSMFVSPKYIGKGLGRQIYVDFEKRVKSQGITKVIVFSDPNSEGFYAHFGFEVIGQEETSIENRFLPILSKTLQ